jgi:hypothetical protein
MRGETRNGVIEQLITLGIKQKIIGREKHNNHNLNILAMPKKISIYALCY